ncbi:MAG: pseudouridine-5'-phosphate glycosidase [Kiritimatiellia bacterium]
MEFVIQPEVHDALQGGRAVVALESTVITHGLPFPDNLEVATDLESIVRAQGAIPATIAVLRGRVHVGLTDLQISELAHSHSARKCSLRDLPVACALALDGSTTVSATMRLAFRSGIRVFATGGIGGVHREAPFDVSNDLSELGRTRMTVVCAGAKSILDLPLTLERLETEGVTVIGYGTDTFPAFYSRSSGLPVDIRCDVPEDVAKIIASREALGLEGSTLVTVPVPAADEVPPEIIEQALARALKEARSQGVAGKDTTPFLLDRISKLTGDASKRANLSLLRQNASVASVIARVLADREKRGLPG